MKIFLPSRSDLICHTPLTSSTSTLCNESDAINLPAIMTFYSANFILKESVDVVAIFFEFLATSFAVVIVVGEGALPPLTSEAIVYNPVHGGAAFPADLIRFEVNFYEMVDDAQVAPHMLLQTNLSPYWPFRPSVLLPRASM